MSADVVLKMTTILKEMRTTQLCSKSEWTLILYERKVPARLHNQPKGEKKCSKTMQVSKAGPQISGF